MVQGLRERDGVIGLAMFTSLLLVYVIIASYART